jgi:hypothetical protein
MIQRSVFLISILLSISLGLFGQRTWDFSRDSVIARLRHDVLVLTAEEMQGRESGTEGERIAALYVKERMKEIGLQPMFDGSFYQDVPFFGELKPGPNNHLGIRREQFTHGEDFFVLPQSANDTVSARVVYVGFGLEGIEGLNGYPAKQKVQGRIVMMEYYLPQGLEGSLDMTFNETLAYRIELAVKKGAAGIIFINSLPGTTDPIISLRQRVPRENIPIVFAKSEIAEQIRKRPRREVALTTQLDRQSLTGLNVAGYWNNNAPTTVVIGGHFDHLGFGGAGSRSPGVVALHPGADDNASGTAGLLETARYLIHSNLTGNNYIFIAFGVEEKGLIGSRYFVNSDAYDMSRINYMFNLDMIGRSKDNNLSLIGTGSSPSWDAIIDGVAHEGLTIRKSPGGLGGSDHAPFYLKGIPVLFFFTGIHDDYHRPGDTPDKVNFEGTENILDVAINIISSLDGQSRLAFSQSQQNETVRRRSDGVSLGVMPDHVYTGNGLRVLAVMPERAASRAGMQNGDVIVRINNHEISEIQSYMRALNQLRPGTTAEVTVKRGDQVLTLPVQL